jgi:hypothetical protein
VIRTIALLAATIFIAACAVAGDRSIVRDGWRWPAPATLPPGATAVLLDVAAIPGAVPAGTGFGCPLALFVPFRIQSIPADTARPVHYFSVADGRELRIRWQPGVSARVTDKLEIVGPDGAVIAREDVAVETLGGGSGNDGVLNACIAKYLPTAVEP